MFQINLLESWGYREREIFHPLVPSPECHSSLHCTKWKPGAGPSRQMQEPKHLASPLLLSQAMSTELDGKRNNWDMDWCTMIYKIYSLASVAQQRTGLLVYCCFFWVNCAGLYEVPLVWHGS